ncbi:Uncharacterised protein [Enterobacter cloacae]|nr:Uncharacterised protein [Enterobacter cloacae]
MNAGFILDLVIQLILGNRFIFLSGLIDRLAGLRQQRADLALLQFDGFNDWGGTRVVNIGPPDGDR